MADKEFDEVPLSVPAELKKRWEQFGEASKACWAEAANIPEAEKKFSRFFECMKTKTGSEAPIKEAESK